ncbi:MAG: 30S ribosome-binding factor RbfA [Acidobacteriota bacterium]
MSHQAFDRKQRLASEIRTVLSETLVHKVNDPRLEGVVISTVRLNRDKTLAKIFFSVVGDEERERQAADGFDAASPFLRRELGRRMRMRALPVLEFSRDDSYVYGDKLERLFDQLHTDGVMPPAKGPEDEE